MRISDWSSDVCSSDLLAPIGHRQRRLGARPEDMAVLGLFDRQFMAVRRGGNGIESRVERPGFLEIGTPARKRKEGIQGASVAARGRSEEHTSELQSLMRKSYAVFCLKKKKKNQ